MDWKVTDESGNLTDEATSEIKRLFRIMDKNGNGRVGVNDVIHSAQMINANPSKTEVEEMIKRVDTDGNGYIEYEEFEDMMRYYYLTLEYQDEQLKDAFKKFDKDGNGSLDVEELKHILCSMGEEFTQEEAEEMFDLVDTDHNGKVSLDEFLTAFRQT